MTTMPDAAWNAAHRAADRITGTRAHASVARGVLAQWIAENGYRWPPPRNNPGNLARGWASMFSYPYSVQTPNPQPGNPIVTFGSLLGGIDCYAAGLVRIDRYNRAVSLARAGDGLGFAVAVCEAGYGTGENVVRSVYAALEAPGSPGSGSHPGGSNVAIKYARITSTTEVIHLRDGQPIYEHPGGPIATRAQRTGDYPHVGSAGNSGGHAWRAVVVKTRWGYTDGQSRPTVLYVPASAGEVRPR
jgi:hypothetical protein